MYHAASSEVFGAAEETPQTERTAFRPTSPYGCAKAFAAQMSRVYREAHGMFVCNGILYNHESPRRGENFVTRKISRQVARIKLGMADQLVLGNVASARDWGHARDYVEAMWRMLQHDKGDDYIVATGKAHTVLEFVKEAFGVAGLEWERHLVCENALERRAEPGRLIGNPQKIMDALGWRPTSSFQDLVAEMVDADLRLAEAELEAADVRSG
jgi:GDPmannose 4,6-dehydratase